MGHWFNIGEPWRSQLTAAQKAVERRVRSEEGHQIWDWVSPLNFRGKSIDMLNRKQEALLIYIQIITPRSIHKLAIHCTEVGIENYCNLSEFT